ncbi:MAG: hypothetical protein K2X38_10635 [Gemmataceae bacterium]|nr:hypothetical protein [Gemmataceae bacterium]
MIARSFLAVVGAAYALLAVWCALLPRNTSRSIGYDLQPGGGQSEYFVVYGGLQIALGLIFLAPLVRPEYTMPSLDACLLIHGILVLMRTISFFLYPGIGSTTYFLAASEWVIFLGSALVWWRAA